MQVLTSLGFYLPAVIASVLTFRTNSSSITPSGDWEMHTLTQSSISPTFSKTSSSVCSNPTLIPAIENVYVSHHPYQWEIPCHMSHATKFTGSKGATNFQSQYVAPAIASMQLKYGIVVDHLIDEYGNTYV